MPTNYPASLDTTTNLPTTIADATTMAGNHPLYHNNEDAALIAIETKVGIGSSTPTNGLLLTGGATPGTSSWIAPAVFGALWRNVLDFGVTGNGSTDDLAAINSCISGAPAGSIIYFPTTTSFYRTTNQINVGVANITLLSFGAEIKMVTSGNTGIRVTVSGVTIDGLRITGPQGTSQNFGEQAVSVAGASSAAYVSNFKITNCTITLWGGYGVRMLYVNKFMVGDCTINNVVYAGIMGLSVIDGRIIRNHVDTIVGTTFGADCYGITVTRNSADSLATDPRPQRVVIAHNMVTNIPNWEGIDSHSAAEISILGNTIYNCLHGINIQTGSGSPTANIWAPLRHIVQGNVIVSNLSDAQRTSAVTVIEPKGISLSGTLGSTTDVAIGCVVSGNTLLGWGGTRASNHGAMKFYSTHGLVVSGNTLIDNGTAAILMFSYNREFSITGNVIQDVWVSNTGIGSGYGVDVQSTDCQGVITGNTFGTNNPARTVGGVVTALNGSAVHLNDPAAGSSTVVGTNYTTSGWAIPIQVDSVLRAQAIRGATAGKAGTPTTTDIPTGTWSVWKDTSGGTLRIWANDGGALKSLTLV